MFILHTTVSSISRNEIPRGPIMFLTRQSEPPHMLGRVGKRPGSLNHDNAETYIIHLMVIL